MLFLYFVFLLIAQTTRHISCDVLIKQQKTYRTQAE